MRVEVPLRMHGRVGCIPKILFTQFSPPLLVILIIHWMLQSYTGAPIPLRAILSSSLQLALMFRFCCGERPQRNLSVNQEDVWLKKKTAYADRGTAMAVSMHRFITPRHITQLAQALCDVTASSEWTSTFLRLHIDRVSSKLPCSRTSTANIAYRI